MQEALLQYIYDGLMAREFADPETEDELDGVSIQDEVVTLNRAMPVIKLESIEGRTFHVIVVELD